jgi:large subunit ribosomal protein L25
MIQIVETVMKIEFNAFPRTLQGTGASRRLRGGGKVPGIVYGANLPAQPIELDHQALYHHLKMEAFHASILDMTYEGNKQQVLLRDVQMHPFRQLVLHVDFQRIDKNKKIHMKVPLHFINAEICPGVKQGGGVVNHVLNDLEISCLPDDLPEYVEVNLDKLELGHTLHVNDLPLPKGVGPIPRLKKENPGVVTVHVPKVVAVDEAAAAPVTKITGQAEATEAAGAGKAAGKDDKKGGGDKKESGKKE